MDRWIFAFIWQISSTCWKTTFIPRSVNSQIRRLLDSGILALDYCYILKWCLTGHTVEFQNKIFGLTRFTSVERVLWLAILEVSNCSEAEQLIMMINKPAIDYRCNNFEGGCSCCETLSMNECNLQRLFKQLI